jgi:glycosyltransferase involved in cell wall biosynthesis
MKIVQVIDQLNVGGAERVLIDLSNLLDENGHDVTVLCLLDKAVIDSHLNKDIPIIYLKRKKKYNPLNLIRLYKILQQFDIVHIHLRQVLRYVSLLFYITQIDKKKVFIFHDHYGRINEDRSISYSLKTALKHCKGYIGVSNQLKVWADSMKLNLSTFKLSNIVRVSSEIKKTDISEDEVKLVSVGNFRPQKNYEFLIELMKSSPINYKFTIYGQIVDEEYYEKILGLIKKNNCSNKISINTNCNFIQSKLSQYHIGVHCAASETGPLVAIEYMSQQLPFIAYDTGEVAIQVKELFPNFIQRNFDVNTWLHSIENILTSRDKYVIQLNDFYTNNYSEETFLNHCLSIYKTLLNTKH